MKHSIIVSLSLLISMYLTACHSATKEKNSDSTIAIKGTFPGFAYIADDKFVILTINADSNRSASVPEIVKADAGLYCSNASDVQWNKIPAQYCSQLNQQSREQWC